MFWTNMIFEGYNEVLNHDKWKLPSHKAVIMFIQNDFPLMKQNQLSQTICNEETSQSALKETPFRCHTPSLERINPSAYN